MIFIAKKNSNPLQTFFWDVKDLVPYGIFMAWNAENLLMVIMTVTAGFFLAISTFARSIAFRVTKGIGDSLSDSINKEECHPPSPAPSSTLKRLGELEEKVDMLQSKLSVMPHGKEELLNAAVYRVDALEAELIATKKVTNCISFQIISIPSGFKDSTPAVLPCLKFAIKLTCRPL